MLVKYSFENLCTEFIIEIKIIVIAQNSFRFKSSIDECQCQPWNFPMAESKQNLPLCTFYGNECFYTKMHNSTHKAQCQCLPGCDEVVYKYYIDRQRKFTPEEISDFCNPARAHREYIRHFEEANFDVLRLKNITMQRSDIWDDHVDDLCKSYVSSQFARIHVRLDGTTHLRRLQSLRYSLGDKLAIIGGTFGLFSGFSFIALFEALHWILVTVYNLVWSKHIKPVVPEDKQENPTDLRTYQKLEEKLQDELTRYESMIKNLYEQLVAHESKIKNLNEELVALKRNDTVRIEEAPQEMIVQDVELDMTQ